MNRSSYVAVAGAALLMASSLASGGATTTSSAAADDCAGAPWMDTRRSADERADLLMGEMTLDEKVSMLHAVSDSAHSRETLPIARLCIPALRLNNGSNGVGSGGPVQPQTTSLPSSLALAASFDPKVARRYGAVMGRETRNIGRNLQEGPDINIARVPLNGRTFEAYGEDPHLAGQIAAATVQGIQSEGTIGEPKHYLANNQEIDRDSIDERIDERTLREIYLPAFETAVKQGQAGAVMCAKNKVNGAFSCEHQELQQGVLKDEWGFDGFVVSDFSSCHDTVRCAEGGLDFELPSGTWYADRLKSAVESGQVSMANLDDHVHRVLATMLRFGLFERPPNTTPIDAERGGADSRAAAEAGTVLLKNDGGLLPLDIDRDRSIAVIGPASHTAVATYGGSTGVAPLYTVSPLDAITRRVGDDVTINPADGMGPVNLGPQPALPAYTVRPDGSPGERGWTARYFDNTSFSGEPVLTTTEKWVSTDPTGGIPLSDGQPVSGLGPDGWSIRWAATFTAPVDGEYTFHLTNRVRARLYLDGTELINNGGGFPGVTRSTTVNLTAGEPHDIRVDWAKSGGQGNVELAWTPPPNTPNVEIAEAVEAAKQSDVAVVFLADKDSEALDRPDLSLPGHQDALVEAVAAANPRTVVVLNSGAPVTMPWLDEVPAVLEMWYPGEEAGNAAASVLFGDTDPSGRLPITFPKRLADTPASTPAQYPGVGGVATYSEGLDVGYRHYDARHIEPLFPFGYGLSYTTFRLDNLRVTTGRVGAVTASVDVTNTGQRRGSQVVQVYVGGADDSGPIGAGQIPPPRRLEGFAKVWLDPGERKTVVVPLGPRAFAHWDSERDAWVQTAGTYTVEVGTSSRDLPLTARVQRDGGMVP
jgi:beta-glucosidase